MYIYIYIHTYIHVGPVAKFDSTPLRMPAPRLRFSISDSIRADAFAVKSLNEFESLGWIWLQELSAVLGFVQVANMAVCNVSTGANGIVVDISLFGWTVEHAPSLQEWKAHLVGVDCQRIYNEGAGGKVAVWRTGILSAWVDSWTWVFFQTNL